MPIPGDLVTIQATCYRHGTNYFQGVYFEGPVELMLRCSKGFSQCRSYVRTTYSDLEKSYHARAQQ